MTLTYLAVAWLAGIAVGRAAVPPWQALVLLGLTGLVGLIGWEGSHRTRLLCACAVMCALGAGRLLLSLPHFDAHSLATYNDVGRVTLEGVVAAEPDEREAYTNLRLRVERVTLPEGQEVEVAGLALVRLARYPAFAYGDRLQVVGLLETPPEWEDFSYREYLARQGVYSLVRQAQAIRLASGEGNPLYAALLALKRSARATIGSILHEPAASLLAGILLGVESDIPADLMENFSATGTTHIIAISGFNITIISGIFAGLSRRLFGRQRATWVAIAGVLLYTLFVGASAAVVRAAIMGSLYLWGRHLGRATFAPVSLAVAAILMTLLNPFVLWDVGFQLSFAATLGLVLYTDPLERGAVRLLGRVAPARQARRVVGWISEALLVTLAAQLTTTPLILYYFRRLSLVTLLSNLLILPAQPAVMIGGGLATLAGLIWLPAGQMLGWVAWLFLTYTIETVRLTARVPYAWLDVGRMSGWMVWGFWGLLGGLTWWGNQSGERKADLRERVATLCRSLTARASDRAMMSVSAILLVLSAVAWYTLPDGRLHVSFLDVGQGDAVFIQTPSGRQVLMDGGPSPSRLLSYLGRLMPFWDHSLDLVILSHPDDDVLAGLLPVLERYRVDGILARDVGCRTQLCTRWKESVESSRARVWSGETGLRIWLDKGLLLTVLHPGPESLSGSGVDYNDHSIVFRLDYGQVCFLFPGDIGAEVEEGLVREEAWLNCTVLKAAHHGDANSTTERFLTAVDPQVVVISVGADNRFHYPHREMLDRLQEAVAIYRTDRDGTVEVVSDGKAYWVERGRFGP